MCVIYNDKYVSWLGFIILYLWFLWKRKNKIPTFFYKVYKEFPVCVILFLDFPIWYWKIRPTSLVFFYICVKDFTFYNENLTEKNTNNWHFLLRYQYRKSSFSRENKCIQPLHHKTCIQKCVSLCYLFREFEECEFILYFKILKKYYTYFNTQKIWVDEKFQKKTKKNDSSNYSWNWKSVNTLSSYFTSSVL